MFPVVPLALGIAMATMVTPSSPALSPVTLTEWQVEIGDHLIVDTQINIGYLVHADGQFTTFPVATGRRKTVCYIGHCYNATTPEGTWEVRSRDIKGDHVTFGPSGRFLRLFRNEGEPTAYGIHEYKFEEQMFSGEDRFKSMGCIIVKKDIMDILDATFSVNEGVIDVVTQYGIAEPLTAAYRTSTSEDSPKS